MKILLIGDACTDIYVHCDVKRLSPEAPVPCATIVRQESKPGMALNVNRNLITLGADVTTVVGDSSIKTRYIDLSGHHLLRVDHDIKATPITLQDLPLGQYDAIVISDYCKGAISYELVEQLVKREHIPIFIDTKKRDLKRMEGTILKVNHTEWDARYNEPENTIVTNGSHPVTVYHRNSERDQYPVAPYGNVVDVCGAGDTFLAAFVYKYVKYGSMGGAIRFAIRASSVTVQHVGCYAPTLDEIGNPGVAKTETQ